METQKILKKVKMGDRSEVNIDNGYGAGYTATQINRLRVRS
jgi:NCAIR mutase (PurE)-related protein